MMMPILKYLSLTFLCLYIFTGSTVAQSSSNFITIGVDQGLSNTNVWSVNQDKYGYIWITTEYGLNRYDGHIVKQYFHKDGDKNSIAGNRVVWAFKDTDGDMWFACGAGGISIYNYTTDNFSSLPAYDSARELNRYKAPVWRVGEDAQKRIYLSCGAACYRYTKATKKFEDLTNLFGPGWDAGIGKFFMQDKNIMWIATDVGLYRYDIPANKMRKIAFDVEKQGFGAEGMRDIEWVNQTELMISMEKAGFVIFDINTEKFRPADDPFYPGRSGKFSEMGDLLMDSKKQLWIANTFSGLVRYFPGNNQSQFIKKDPLYPFPYPEQEGQGKGIFEDRDGNIWYATSRQGVIRFQPNINFLSIYKRDYARDNSLPGDHVSVFFPGKNNSIWIGTWGNGICNFDITNTRYSNYTPTILPNDQRPGNYIRAITTSQNKVMIISEKGLTVFNEQTKQFKTYSPNATNSNQPVPDGSIRRMYETEPGQLLFVSDRISTFNVATGEYFFKDSLSKDPLSAIDKITASSFDKISRQLWLITNKKNLLVYDLQNRTLVKHELGKVAVINIIHADDNGKIWIGTDENIFEYDPVLKKAGWSIAAANPIVNISSNKEWAWYTTKNEIGRINRASGKKEIFNANNLLPNINFSGKSLLKAENGMLWLGSNAGFSIIDPAKYTINQPVKVPALTGFKVFDNPRNFDLPYSELKEINLNYKDNFFSFTFSSFDFQEGRSVGYAYRLDKFDKEWKYSNQTAASYTNVPPGDYVLLVRPANSSDESLQKQLIIRIHPPFWNTSWFAVCVLMACIALFTWLWKLRKKSQSKNRTDATIDYFANSVYGENSVNEICWDIARNCIAQLQFEDCVVYIMDEEKNKLVQKAAYGPKNPKGHDLINPISIDPGAGIVGAVAISGKLLLVNDTSKDERYIVDDIRRYSELAVPILHNDKVIGVIDSENSKKHFYTTEHVKAMTTIASISGNKIAEAQAREHARENELKFLEIKKMLAESQLMALRAQMNPHFVFNCLNSIQECIVTNKYKEATTYLNKFSKLFRMVLNNSGKNLVTLEEEKNVLELYLELEYMRFENKFKYEIKMDEELESDEILIPSMLLQPYVENALWHGLMHKDGERILQISFEKVNEDIFRCSIDDNGIGRKRSFELKEKQSKTKRHESKGLSISSDRLDVLNRQGYHAQLQIIDKFNDKDEPVGTLVMIELSTFLKN